MVWVHSALKEGLQREESAREAAEAGAMAAEKVVQGKGGKGKGFGKEKNSMCLTSRL